MFLCFCARKYIKAHVNCLVFSPFSAYFPPPPPPPGPHGPMAVGVQLAGGGEIVSSPDPTHTRRKIGGRSRERGSGNITFVALVLPLVFVCEPSPTHKSTVICVSPLTALMADQEKNP